MTERSLFNVACKLLGLFSLFRGISSLIWAFVASRFALEILFEPAEMASWFTGAGYIVFGLFLCASSSGVTRFLFRLDGPLDETQHHDLESPPSADR